MFGAALDVPSVMASIRGPDSVAGRSRSCSVAQARPSGNTSTTRTAPSTASQGALPKPMRALQHADQRRRSRKPKDTLPAMRSPRGCEVDRPRTEDLQNNSYETGVTTTVLVSWRVVDTSRRGPPLRSTLSSQNPAIRDVTIDSTTR